MSFIEFIFLIIIIIPVSKDFYNLKYGHLYMYYFSNSNCQNDYETLVTYSIPDNEDYIRVLNTESNIVNYSYSFDYFSSQIYYGDSDNEDDEEEAYKSAFVCNGNCYKRKRNSDILVDPDTISADYEELNDVYLTYSCSYNNIIQTATIKIERFSEKKCKNKLGEELNYDGEQDCWPINSSYSYRPLYYEDTNGHIFYRAYNSTNCTSENFEYFTINENYIKCNSRCHKDRTDNESYYRCTFKANNDKYIKEKRLLIFLFLVLLFN